MLSIGNLIGSKNMLGNIPIKNITMTREIIITASLKSKSDIELNLELPTL